MASPGRNLNKSKNADPKVENEAQPQKRTSSDPISRRIDSRDERAKAEARKDREVLESGGEVQYDEKGRKSYKR